MKRAARYALIGIAALVVVVVALLLVLTRTDFGVEQAGQYALERIRGSIEGELAVDDLTSGGLLRGVTLHGVTLTGPDGRSFVEADSARLAYRLRTLLSGSVVFDRLILHGPTVTIERLPGNDDWNYELIFPSDTTAPDTADSGSLVLLRDATIHDGRVIVRTPWEPDGPVEPDDTARLILESVPGGLVRTWIFEDVNARAPRIVWETPDDDAKLIEVAELSTRAYVWETPADVESLEGNVTIRDSLVSFEAPRVRLPDSELGVVGRIILADDKEYDLEVDGRDVAFADFQWLYPPLPQDGGGTLQFRLQTRPRGGMLWLARDARLRTSGTDVAGSFGVVTGDTLYFTEVDLEASPLDLELLQQLVPSRLPLEGLLIGTIEVEGPISSLQTRGDVRLRTFADGEGAESEVRWRGRLGVRRPYAMAGLTADIGSLDLEQVAQFAPGLKLRGTATGRVEATGSLERGLDVTADVVLDRDGARSAVQGSGRFAVGGDRSAFDLRFEAAPLGLDLLVEQFPELGRLAGEARGPVTVTGSLDDLRVDADLMTPAGAILLHGTFGLAGPVPSYRAEGTVTDFQLDRVARDLPETTVTGRFDIDGKGTGTATMDAQGTLEVHSARVAGVQVLRSLARGRITDGLLRFDSLFLSTEVGEAVARGSLGIVPDRVGELTVTADAHTLARLEPAVFPEPLPAELGIEPEVRLAGQATARGVIQGSVHDWRVRGSASGRGLVWDDLVVAEAESDFDWRPDGGTIDVSVDSLRYDRRRLPHARATVNWAGSAGQVVARARGTGAQELEVEGSVARLPGALDLHLRQLALATRDGRWTLADSVRARVGREGIRLDSLTLVRGPDPARLRVAGTLPWREAGDPGTEIADLAIELDSVRLGELFRVAQVDTVMDGAFTGRLQVSGTALSPRIDGRVVARPFRYGGAVLDSAGAEVTYRDQVLRTRFAGWRSDDPLVSGDGAIPIDLSLTELAQRRLDRPMSLRFRADSIPAGLVSFLAPGFSEFTGAVDGTVAVVGTTRSPALEGRLHLIDGSALFRPLNVRYRDMNVTASMGTARLVEIDARLATRDGTGHVSGTLDLAEPGDPVFDLTVDARKLNASRRRDVVAVATGRAHVGGRYTRPVVSGDVEIVEGEMNLDEIWRQYQIVQLDPSLVQLFDSTAVRFEPPAEIPFLENLLLTDATIVADRDFWLRSRELNVEVSGTLDVEVDRMTSDLRLTGTLQALDGSYSLQLVQGVPGRVFDIRGGAVEFVGTPGIDPNLDIQAGYRVRRAQGDPIEVVAQVSGTLKDPRVALTSDSDLQLSESDLASYILFGRSGAELTQAETDVLSSGIGLVRPVATSIVSSEIQRALAGTGLPIDYVAFTTPEYGVDQLGAYWQSQGLAGVFHNTQVEVGFDAGRDLSLVVSGRIPTDATASPEGFSLWRQFGARVEWRLHPTWTTEFFIEDRFARTPSFGLTEIDDRKVWGFSLFRDWGY